MKEQSISFETAKLAKEKGFNITCDNIFLETLEHTLDMGRGGNCTFPAQEPRVVENRWGYDKWEVVHCQAPTQALLQRWLREVHNIEVLVSRIPPEAILASKTSGKSILKNYNCYVWNYNSNPRVLNNGTFQDVYEEALEIGLQEALKLIP